MLMRVITKLINNELIKTYRRNIKRFGFTPMGVFWNSKTSQYNRFKVIFKLLFRYSSLKKLEIADIGCGYGEFLKFLKENKSNYSYKGYDINSEIIKFCNKRFTDKLFEVSDFPQKKCDFCIISGTYNYAVIDDLGLWESYIIKNLVECFKMCNLGIIVNFQVSNFKKIKNNIFYTDINSMGSLLRKKFKNVEHFEDTLTSNDVYFIILR